MEKEAITNYKEILVQSLIVPLSLARRRDSPKKRRARNPTVILLDQMDVDNSDTRKKVYVSQCAWHKT